MRLRGAGRDLARVIGKLGAFRAACPAALIAARGLMRSLNTLPSRHRPSQAGARDAERRGLLQWRDYSGTATLTPLAVAELRFWLAGIFKLRGAPLYRRIQVVAFTDASPDGYGSVWTRARRAGGRRRFDVEQLRGGRWQQHCDEQSTHFELRALALMVQEHGAAYRGCRVHACTDNVGAAHIAGQGCMSNQRLHAMALELWAVCVRYELILSTQYLCGDGIIQSGADALSRDSDAYNCTLHKSVFAEVWDWVGGLDVDCFASPGAVQRDPSTDKELQFVSPYGGEAIADDGLTFVPEQELRLYAFPPAPLLEQFLCHALRERLRVVVIVPRWITQAWWSLIAEYNKLELGVVSEVLQPGEAGLAHPFGAGYDSKVAEGQRLLAVRINM